MTSDPKEISVTIQDVDRESMKYIKTERDDPSWAAQEGQLLIPASNLDLIFGVQSTGTSIDIFVLVPGKCLCFLMTRATEKGHVDPENLVLFFKRLRDFLEEREVKELSLPVHDPNRGRLHPRELYALIHVIFSDTNLQVYVHKKLYLSIG